TWIVLAVVRGDIAAAWTLMTPDLRADVAGGCLTDGERDDEIIDRLREQAPQHLAWPALAGHAHARFTAAWPHRFAGWPPQVEPRPLDLFHELVAWFPAHVVDEFSGAPITEEVRVPGQCFRMRFTPDDGWRVDGFDDQLRSNG